MTDIALVSEKAPLRGGEDAFPKALEQQEDQGVNIAAVRTSRTCTDVYCSFVFLFFFLCLWCIGGWSYQNGFPGKLLRGWDLYGNTCGYEGFIPREYTYFAAPLKDIDVTLCLSGCPVVEARESVCLYEENGFPLTETGCFDAYPSKPFFNKYCLPSDYHMRKKVLLYLYSEDKVMSRVVGDMSRAWDILAIMLTITGTSVLAYIIVLKVPDPFHKKANLVFYLINLIFMLFLFFILVFLIYEEKWRVKAKICDDFGPVHMPDCDEGDTGVGYSYLAWVVASILFVIVCCIPLLIRKLMSGIKSLKAAASIYPNDPGVFVCWFALVVIGVGFYAYFITLIIYTVGTGEHLSADLTVMPRPEANVWHFYTAPRVLIFFDIFMILWHFSFLAHAMEFVSASAAAHWMFERKKKTMFPLARALWHLVRYHLGSVFLASIIVPCWRFPRDSLLGKKVNYSEALAYQALTGNAFFVSARQSTALLLDFDSDLKAREKINNGNSILWIYQLTIMLISPVLVYFWLQHKDITFQDMSIKEVTSVLAMALYSLFFSWYLSMLYGCLFKGLLHGGVICFLLDKKNNDEDHRRAPDDFTKFMNEVEPGFNPVRNEGEDQSPPRTAWNGQEPRDSGAHKPAPPQDEPDILIPEDGINQAGGDIDSEPILMSSPRSGDPANSPST